MKIYGQIAACCLLLMLSGCSVKNDFNLVLPANYQVQQKNYNLQAVNAQLAPDSKKTGDIDVFDPAYTQKFENALVKVLNDAKFFKNDAQNSLQIKVLILKNDAPAMGFDMSVDTDVLYEIKDQNGHTLYSKVIQSQGIATVGDEFVGLNRMILANDRAVRNNIQSFIDDIKSKSF